MDNLSLEVCGGLNPQVDVRNSTEPTLTREKCESTALPLLVGARSGGWAPRSQGLHVETWLHIRSTHALHAPREGNRKHQAPLKTLSVTIARMMMLLRFLLLLLRELCYYGYYHLHSHHYCTVSQISFTQHPAFLRLPRQRQHQHLEQQTSPARQPPGHKHNHHHEEHY